MQFIIAVASLAAVAAALPGKAPPPYGPTSVTSTPPSPSSTGAVVNHCLGLGIDVLSCAQLGNISGLNGNTINILGKAPTTTAAPKATPVSSPTDFVNACKGLGITIGDCSQILNLGIGNGNNIDILGGVL